MFLPYADDPPREGKFAWMNWLLIAVNTAVFAAYGSSPYYDQIVLTYGFTPNDFSVVTLFTSMFLHGSWMHLIGNMWFLYLFGDNVENRLGPWLYLCSYLLCGVCGSLTFYAFFMDSGVPSVGASGAIFGIMGMYLLLFPRNQVRVVYFIIILIGRVIVPAVLVIGLWAGLELLYSRMQATQGMESGIGHLAHAGGFITGVILAPMYAAVGAIPNYGDELWNWLLGSTPPSRPLPGRNGETARERWFNEPTGVRPGIDPRDEVVGLLRAGRANEARRAWYHLSNEFPDAVLPPGDQLDLAQTLERSGDTYAARDAYERLLSHYRTQPFAAEANLSLAGLLLRRAKETGDRREMPLIAQLLQQAAHDHPQPARRALAEHWLHSLAFA